MNNPIHSLRPAAGLLAIIAAALLAAHAGAQVPSVSPNSASIPSDSPATAGATQSSSATASPAAANTGAQPSHEEMMKMMMETAKLNENHKLLGELVGNWSYTVKMWMDPNKPPTESKGTATRKAEMGGRYFVADTKGKFQMPGPDGKLKDFDFQGRATEAYDNAKQKFVSTWIDNMATGIMMSEGTYDPATKTFTYHFEHEMAPGLKTKIRETIKVNDKDHHTLEWFEQRGGQEVKTMEIAYTRAGKK